MRSGVFTLALLLAASPSLAANNNAATIAPSNYANAAEQPRPSLRFGQSRGAIAAPNSNTYNLSFPSKSYRGTRQFSLWLPDSYAAGKRRYPVLYWLHGKGGNPQRSAHIASYLKQAIAAGHMPETGMVFPDGDTDRFYTDDAAGHSPVETMIIEELIPYIDGHYRTLADRQHRLIEGFSMGGFGALKFAAKYPEKFASVVAYGAPRLDADLGMGGRDQEVFENVFGNDIERFRRETPSYLFQVNKARVLNAGLKIRLVSGSEDGTRYSVQKLDETLKNLGIAHEYVQLPNVRHTPGMYYEAAGDAGFVFHAHSLLAQPAPAVSCNCGSKEPLK